MSDGTAPETSNTREPLIVELTGQETTAELQDKAKKVIQELGLLLIKENGLDSPMVDDVEAFKKEIESQFWQRLRYPSNVTQGYADNLTAEFYAALDSEAPALSTTVQLVKAGKVVINALGETPSRLLQLFADPVMLFNGQFTHLAHDLHINGAGINFDFVRTYKNQGFYKGPLGINWDHGYNLWLRVSEDQRTITRSTGALREDTYVHHELLDYWMPPNGVDSVILREAGRFVARLTDGTRLIYKESAGDLALIYLIDRIEDRFGNYLTFIYQDSQLRFMEVNHPKRVVEYIYDEMGRIVTISDYVGRIWRYSYDDFADLVSVTTPRTDQYAEGCTVSYEYSSPQFTGELQHNLTRIIDAEGQIYLENEYGTSPKVLGFNQVITQRQGGGLTLFEYEDVIEEFDFDYGDAERPTHQTNLIDRNGHGIHYIYNRTGNLLFKEEYLLIDGEPHLLKSYFRYNRDGNLVAAMTPEGVITQYLYGREHFIRTEQIQHEDDLIRNADLTAQVRQGFTRLLATLRRARYYDLEHMNLARGVWGDIFPDVFGALEPDSEDEVNDIIVKFTYEPIYGLLLSQSDARFTISPDPSMETLAEGEHERYAETLTRYRYMEPPIHSGMASTLFLVKIDRPTPTRADSNPGDPVVEKFTRPDPNDPTQEIPAYDHRGRLLRHVSPTGTITELVYFPEDPNDPREGYLERTVADSGGKAITTSYVVDALGRAIEVHLPRSAGITDGRFVTRTVYDELDQVRETVTSEPFGFRTRRFYARTGTLHREERDLMNESGNGILGGVEVRTFCFNEELQPVRQTIGGLVLSTHLVTEHSYDEAGQRVLTVLPNGNQIRYRYDARGQLIARTRGAGTPEASTTRTDYDDDGRVRRTFSALGNPTTFTLDAFGRLLTEENALGHIIQCNYDKLGNLTVQRAFESRPDGYYLLARHEAGFDELGRANRVAVNRFDEPLGPVSREQLEIAFLASPGPGTRLLTQGLFDSQGRLIQAVNPLSQTYLFEYDSFDHVIQETDPLGNRVLSQYDAAGNLLRLDRIDLIQQAPNTITRVFSASYAYDEMDRMVTSTDSLGNVTQVAYDSRNNAVRYVDPLGNVIRAEFNVLNYRIAEHRELTNTGLGGSTLQANASIGFDYDQNGNLTGFVDGLGRKTQYSFDALDRRRKVVFPDGSWTSSDYDPDGSLIRCEDNNGVQRLYTVDALGLTTSVQVEKSHLSVGIAIEGATFERYTYDGLGRCVSEENDNARSEIAYNSLGWPIGETIHFAIANAALNTPLSITRDFDDMGLVTGLTYPNGRRLSLQRDQLNRLTVVKNMANGVNYPGNPTLPSPYAIANFEYAGRQRGQLRYSNGAITKYAYDGDGRNIEITHSSTQPLLTVQYLFDAAGNLRVRNDIRQVAQSGEGFSYDSLYRLAMAAPKDITAFDSAMFLPPLAPSNPIPNRQADIDARIGAMELPPAPHTFDYDLVGNRKEEQDGHTTHFEVNQLDQYTRITKDTANPVLLTYDRNGNLTNDGQYQYIYDYRNRLVRITSVPGNSTIAQFFHDTRGHRILEQHQGGQSEQLVYDRDNLFAEYRNGKPFALYVNDDGVDKPLQIAAEGSEHWYHTDLLGSVRVLTDSNGNEAAEYRYDSFGVLIEEGVSPVHNPLHYTGRRLDVASGTYDLRAREYLPVLGRFLQRDPVGIFDNTNLYIYTANNPLHFVDSHGLGRREKATEFTEGPVTGMVSGHSYVGPDGTPWVYQDSVLRYTGDHPSCIEHSWHSGAFGWHLRNDGSVGPPRTEYHNWKGAEHATRGEYNIAEIAENEQVCEYCHIVRTAGHVPTDQEFDLHALSDNALFYADVASFMLTAASITRPSLFSVVREAESAAQSAGSTATRSANRQFARVPAWRKVVRSFWEDRQTFNQSKAFFKRYRAIFTLERQANPATKWSLEHLVFKQRWYRGATPLFPRGTWGNKLLQGLGDAGWNVLPMPHRFNQFLVRPLISAGFTAGVYYGGYQGIEKSYEAGQYLRSVIDDQEEAP